MGVLGITGMITGAAGVVAVLWRVWRWGSVLVEGMRCQLRSDMTRIYYRNRGEKTLRQYEYENFCANYTAYLALGGNSFVRHIREEVDGWEVLP